MRILYGAFAQGQGHFSKAAVLVPWLEARGHEVWLVSSGPRQPPPGYHFPRHRHYPGLAYVSSGGCVGFVRTAGRWGRELPQALRHLWQMRRLIDQFQPELIISDFEPLSASPLLRAPCEVVALSRQAVLIDPGVPLPDEADFERKLTRSVIRLFTAGADRLLGYHYAPDSAACVPPIIRPDAFRARSEPGDHLLVYNACHPGDGGSAQELIDWSRRRRCPVRAYGFPDAGRGRRGLVEFRDSDRRTFLEDLRTARAVITTAGFTTPVEAFLLGKPAAVVALPRQWEQRVNAFHLERAHVAAPLPSWDYDRVLELAPPAAGHPLREWLTTSPEVVLDSVLGDRARPSSLEGRTAGVPRAA